MMQTTYRGHDLHEIAEGGDLSNSNSSSDDSDGKEVTSDSVDGEIYVEKIAHRETRYVTYLRLGLLLTLFVAASVVSATVYLFVSGGENDEFEKAFVSYSTKVTETFQSIADRRLGAIAAFSTTITTFAIATNSTWPFVTVPNFEAQARHIGKLANVENIGFAPIVSTEERQEWEDVYVPQNVFKWQSESLATNALFDLPSNITSPPPIIGKQEYYEGQPDFSKGYSHEIVETRYTPEGVRFYIVTGEGPYMPWFQTAPFRYGSSGGIVNLDLDIDPTFEKDTLITILSKGKAALGKVARSGYGSNTDPASGFYYPVLEGIADNSTVVGSLGTLIFWLPYFADILPESAVGFIGVLENTCNQTFTFRIDGSSVAYIGEGDQHDSKYDYLKQEVSFLDLINKSIESKGYLGLPIDEDGCQYILSIYASADLEAVYKSDKPLIYMLVAMMIFLVTSLLFVLYDRLVERRQRLVMHQAESSGAIVSSLFPAAYRERLMAAQGNDIAQRNGGKLSEGAKESKLQSFLNGENTDAAGANDEPIADNFPACTVMFADISGFTQWSSAREPGHVFCLLQEVYRDFDLIAKRLRVFKVETIGDCYMAVTGLPTPQPNHARLMARFANECLLQIKETTSRLVEKLGDDTSDLTLRIGLHSGPVTAGILRGEKSRFQLFGDTVNTASRMESTGESNRIQISESTAKLIEQAGKGHWLIPREEFVEAKGKGMLKTFWLGYERSKSTISSVPKSLGTSSNDNDDNEDFCVMNNASCRSNSVGELLSI